MKQELQSQPIPQDQDQHQSQPHTKEPKPTTGILRSICTSPRRGTPKTPVTSALLVAGHGIQGDAHAGSWHRQVSILPLSKIDEFNQRGADVIPGSFGENMIVEGADLKDFAPGTLFSLGDALLEITQIGKECHQHCAIYKRMGDCIMPREGVFARVIRGGTIQIGDPLLVTPKTAGTGTSPFQATMNNQDQRPGHGPSHDETAPEPPFTAAVVTLSDRSYRGETEDESGPWIARRLTSAGYEVLEAVLLPDDEAKIREELTRLADTRQVNLIITTGGTGFAPRDVTPEATMAVATRNAPGIAEFIRRESCRITRRAMLSRAASVIRNRTLIVNLPGSRKAVEECLEMILDELSHGLNILLEREKDCGRHHHHHGEKHNAAPAEGHEAQKTKD